MTNLFYYEDQDGNYRIRNEDNRSIALAYDEQSAALFTAAPELLQALKDLVDACDGNYKELTEECQKVIAKAEGK